jgi:hypothetical protein
MVTGEGLLSHHCLVLTVIFALLIAGVMRVGPVLADTRDNPVKGSSLSGRSLFFGETPLRGIIQGHDRPLSPELVRCANCHLPDSRSTSGVSNVTPRLDRSGLTELRRRRGGPPSQFTPSSFCRLLRTGVDPAYILITRQMPRYTLEDAQCLDLWQYLMEQGDAPQE